MPALAQIQHDERVTCTGCRFRYPAVRGYCPVCGIVAPSPMLTETAVPVPVNRLAGMGTTLRAVADGQARKLLIGFAVILAVACGVLFLRARDQRAIVRRSPVLVNSSAEAVPGEVTPVVNEKGQQPVSKHASPVVQAAARELVPATPETPEQIWNRVRAGDTHAEVLLARMYLDGNGVAQSCEQAHLLLTAASRKHSEEADHALSNLYPSKCH